MAYQEHPRLYKVEGNPTMCRYIDLTKFLSMLHKQSLFFTRVDKMEDPFEGSYAKKNHEARKEWYRHMEKIGFFKDVATDDEIEKAIANYDWLTQKMPAITTINCWHKSETESALMWKSYSSTNSGIMLKSNFARVVKSMEETKQNVYISEVHYLDYNIEVMPDGNTFLPFIHKQNFYTHENEIRLLHEVPNKGFEHDWSKEDSEFGVNIQVNLDILIEEIIVAPFVQKWYIDLIASLNERYGLNKPIKISQLAKQ